MNQLMAELNPVGCPVVVCQHALYAQQLALVLSKCAITYRSVQSAMQEAVASPLTISQQSCDSVRELNSTDVQ